MLFAVWRRAAQLPSQADKKPPDRWPGGGAASGGSNCTAAWRPHIAPSPLVQARRPPRRSEPRTEGGFLQLRVSTLGALRENASNEGRASARFVPKRPA